MVVDTIAEIGDKPAFVDVSPEGRYAFVTLIGERAAGDPPNRLSGRSPGSPLSTWRRGKSSTRFRSAAIP